MAPASQRQKARAGVFPELDATIQDLNLARDTCGVPSAQVAFGSTSDLMVSTGVCSLTLHDDKLPVNVYSGLHSRQTGLPGPRAVLRRHMQSPRSWVDWGRDGRMNSATVRARGD